MGLGTKIHTACNRCALPANSLSTFPFLPTPQVEAEIEDCIIANRRLLDERRVLLDEVRSVRGLTIPDEFFRCVCTRLWACS